MKPQTIAILRLAQQSINIAAKLLDIAIALEEAGATLGSLHQQQQQKPEQKDQQPENE